MLRHVDGILLLDKPLHLTSNAALQKVKRIFHARKAGHTGSLDPLATGLLPICFGEATKFSQFLLDSDKKYYVKARLGIVTTTGDAEGQIVEQNKVGTYSREQLISALASFEGEIKQIPSMYSALKHQGQPLYKLARQGIEVERKARDITIYSLELLDVSEFEISFNVHCSKGTYVRSLVEDIGKNLGCGAHVSELRRLAVGPYNASNMITLQQLDEAPCVENFILPVSTSVSAWPAIYLTESACFQVQHGQTVRVASTTKPGLVRLLTNDNVFLGVGEILDDGKIAPRRLLARRVECFESRG